MGDMKAITSTSDQARVWDKNWNLIGIGSWDGESYAADITAWPSVTELVKSAIIAGENVYVTVEAEGGRIAAPVYRLEQKRGRWNGIRTTLTLC